MFLLTPFLLLYGRKLGKDYKAIIYLASLSYNKVERFHPQPN